MSEIPTCQLCKVTQMHAIHYEYAKPTMIGMTKIQGSVFLCPKCDGHVQRK